MEIRSRAKPAGHSGLFDVGQRSIDCAGAVLRNLTIRSTSDLAVLGSTRERFVGHPERNIGWQSCMAWVHGAAKP